MKEGKKFRKAMALPSMLCVNALFVGLILLALFMNLLGTAYFSAIQQIVGNTGKLSAATERAAIDLYQQIASEGAVLLKNERVDTNLTSRKILPLQTGAKVTLLGKTTVDFLYSGTGGGIFSIDATKGLNFKQALEAKGILVNPTVWSAYTELAPNYPSVTPPVIPNGITDYFAVNEVPFHLVENAVTTSKNEYNDCAIVVLSRSGGEGNDLPNSYLYLTEAEKDLLKNACANFENVVVLAVCNNTLQLRWLEDGFAKVVKENIDIENNRNDVTGFEDAPQQILTDVEVAKIKGAVWTGGVGIYGLTGIASVLTGEVSPSGSLVDTWAYDVMSAPANNYIGAANYNNNNTIETDLLSNYTVNHEGIFVGYRYYESRYYDLQKGQNNAQSIAKMQNTTAKNWSYKDKELGVQYPFGYGLSYTTFRYTLIDNPVYNREKQSIEQKIQVQNTGQVAGKTAVQLYVQTPQNNAWGGYKNLQFSLLDLQKQMSFCHRVRLKL